MTSFDILAVRAGEAEDSPLYPFPGEQPDTVESDNDDGQPFPVMSAGELNVYELSGGSGPKRLIRARKLKAAVRVTESRVYVACSKYEKGGGWMPWTLGAVPVAVAANVVSRARAARRRRGKMLVGHIRYSWLLSVGFKARRIPAGHDTIQLIVSDPTVPGGRELSLEITLARQHSGGDVARQVASMAASYQLAGRASQLDDSSRELLRSLESPASLTPAPRQFVAYSFRDTARNLKQDGQISDEIGSGVPTESGLGRAA